MAGGGGRGPPCTTCERQTHHLKYVSYIVLLGETLD